MSQIEWQASFNTGIEEIDVQHKQILEYLNQLEQASKGEINKTVTDVLGGIVDYTLSHFAFEEALMSDANYSCARAHKSVHDLFIKRIDKFQAKFNAGEDIFEELYNVLRRWLINHIQRDDAAYVRPINEYLNSTKSSSTEREIEQPRKNWMKRAVKQFFGFN